MQNFYEATPRELIRLLKKPRPAEKGVVFYPCVVAGPNRPSRANLIDVTLQTQFDLNHLAKWSPLCLDLLAFAYFHTYTI